MIVKNESSMLKRCLESIQPIADELIIVDTGSTDNTIEIAHSFDATVIQSGWKNDFAFARNLSIRAAKGTWIAWFDGDDRLTPESIAEIHRLKQSKPACVYGFIVRNQKPGGTGSEFIQARMFPNRPDIFFERPIHEQIMLSAMRAGLTMTNTAITVEHYGYADPATMIIKSKRNIAILLSSIDQKNPDPITALEIADGCTITGDIALAKEWYERVLLIPDCMRAFPEILSSAYLGLARMQIDQKQYVSAILHLEQALALAPRRVDVRFSLAVAYEKSGSESEAIKQFELILNAEEKAGIVSVDFRETRLKTIIRITRLLCDQKLFDRALSIIDNGLRVFNERPELNNCRGMVYVRSGKLMDALHAFELSLKTAAAGNLNAYIGLCVVYVKAGKREIAIQALENIRNEFVTFNKYWAYYSIVKDSIRFDIPVECSVEKVAEEVEQIKSLYGL